MQNDVTVEEAAEDLKLRPSQIRSIEEGKIEDFKDVFYLKYFIRDYAKYLGLDGSKLVDQFNEFLFLSVFGIFEGLPLFFAFSHSALK